MKRNNLIILIALLNISITGFSIGNGPIKDTMMYFAIDIRSNTNHSIVISGVIKKFDYSKLSIENVDGFIASFYNQGYFVPNFLIYDEAIKECAKLNGDSALIKYMGQGQRLMNMIAGHGQKTKIILESGENVFIEITKISGLFLHCSKEKIQLPTVSNELPLYEIEEISNIYVPIEILSYNKLSRRCVKEMLKR